MNVTPNPGEDQFSLNYTTDKDEEIEVAITDITGRVVYLQRTNVSQGRNAIMLDLGYLNSGMYSIKVTGAATMLTEQLIVR